MRLIIGQLPIKAGWRDAHITPWDLKEAICQNIISKKAIVFNGLSSKFKLSLRRAGSAPKFKILRNSLSNLRVINFF